MELGEISPAIAAVEFYLAQNLGVIQFLAETAIFVLDKSCCENNTIRNFQKFLFIAAFMAGYVITSYSIHYTKLYEVLAFLGHLPVVQTRSCWG